jgi:hypothetical protein
VTADNILKLVATLQNDPAEIVVAVVDAKTVAARVRTGTTVLYEGTGATSDEAMTALQTAVTEAVATEAAALDDKAAALRAALKGG